MGREAEPIVARRGIMACRKRRIAGPERDRESTTMTTTTGSNKPNGEEEHIEST